MTKECALKPGVSSKPVQTWSTFSLRKPDVFTYSSVMTACLKEQKREQKMGPSDVGRRFGSVDRQRLSFWSC